MYRTGVKVQIIEPGGFKTNIWGRGNIRRQAEEKVASLPAEVRSQLPPDAVNKRKEISIIISILIPFQLFVASKICYFSRKSKSVVIYKGVATMLIQDSFYTSLKL